MHGWLAVVVSWCCSWRCCGRGAGLLCRCVDAGWPARAAPFECSVRLQTATPGAGWVLGMARYNAEMLEWFRFFSYSSRPRKSFLRDDVRVVDDREPDAVEAVALYAGQRVVDARGAAAVIDVRTLGAGDGQRLVDRFPQLAGGGAARPLGLTDPAPPQRGRAATIESSWECRTLISWSAGRGRVRRRSRSRSGTAS